jgi:hypothetical protein
MNEAKLHHVCVMNGPKGPSCVWSKAPFGLKKYPAVAGYLMKMEQSSTKTGQKIDLIGMNILFQKRPKTGPMKRTLYLLTQKEPS